MVRPGIALYGGRAVGGRPQPDGAGRDARSADPAGARTPGPARPSAMARPRSLDARQPPRHRRHRLCRRLLPRPRRQFDQAGGRAVFRGRIAAGGGPRLDGPDHRRRHRPWPELPQPGEMVEILGPHISVDDQADVAGTIGYEILTALEGPLRAHLCPAMPAGEPAERGGERWPVPTPGCCLSVRLVHTAIYIVNAAACFVLLYAGLSGTSAPSLGRYRAGRPEAAILVAIACAARSGHRRALWRRRVTSSTIPTCPSV